MDDHLLARITWLEEEVTLERKNELESLSVAAKAKLLRDTVRKNAMAIGLRRLEIDALDDEEIAQAAQTLSAKYGHYLDRMERRWGR